MWPACKEKAGGRKREGVASGTGHCTQHPSENSEWGLLPPAGKGSALQMRKLRLEEISELQDQAHKPGICGHKGPPFLLFLFAHILAV